MRDDSVSGFIFGVGESGVGGSAGISTAFSRRHVVQSRAPKLGRKNERTDEVCDLHSVLGTG